MALAGWTQVWSEAWALGCEASAVVALRASRIAGGGAAADRELWMMWSEKFDAAAELQASLWSGALGTTPLSATRGAVRHYRGKVRANRRRLG